MRTIERFVRAPINQNRRVKRGSIGDILRLTGNSKRTIDIEREREGVCGNEEREVHTQFVLCCYA